MRFSGHIQLGEETNNSNLCAVFSFFWGGVGGSFFVHVMFMKTGKCFFCWLVALSIWKKINNIVNSISLVSCVVSTVMHTSVFSVHCVYCFAKSVRRHCVYSCANPSNVLQIHCVLHPYYSMHLEAELAESV